MATEKENTLIGFVFDFETGSLNCQTGACTQIAIHAVNLATFEKIGSYMSYIAPYNRKEVKGVSKRKVLKNKYEAEEVSMEYTEKALKYSDITKEMLEQKGQSIEVVAREVVDFIASNTPKTPKNLQPFLIGQNPEFDKGFFQQLMEYGGCVKEVSKYIRGNTDFYGNWQPETLDTIMLGQLALCHKPEVTTYKLEIMCENLGIELDDAHDADADVTATSNVVNVLAQKMRNNSEALENGEVALLKTEKSRKHFKI